MTRPVLRFLPRTRPVRRTTALAVLAGTATVCCGVGLFATAGWLIARAAEHPGIQALAVAIVAVRGFGIARGLCRYAERVLSHDAAMRGLSDVRPRAYARLIPLTPAGLPLAGGDLLRRIVGDVEAVQDLLVRGLTPSATAVLAGAAATVLAGLLFPPAGVVLAVGLLLAAAGVPWLVAALDRRTGRAATDARARLSTSVGGVIDGAADLIAFGADQRALAVCRREGERQSALARTAARLGGTGAGLAVLVSAGTVWAVLALGAPATARGDLDRVVLVVVVLIALAAFEVAATMPAVAAALAAARRSAERLAEVLDAPDPVREPEVPASLPAGPAAVRLRAVRVRYAPDAAWALDGIDLDLPPGRRVAVVGPSGSGKSTLVSVLLRFRDVDGGQVTLHGRDIRTYRSDDVRRCIGGCPSDPHIFTGTLLENLRLARPSADLEEVEAAARAVGLLDWVRTLPQGWSTPVGHRGALISGGERQRLALARTLLADPEVVVLDEPAAHLDPEMRTAVTSTVLDVTRGRSTVLVTHDLTALPAMDEILVLDAGHVLQRGTHAELLDRPGLYRQMWDLERPPGKDRARRMPAAVE